MQPHPRDTQRIASPFFWALISTLMALGACGANATAIEDGGAAMDSASPDAGADAPTPDMDVGARDAGESDSYVPPAVDGGFVNADGWCGEGEWAVCVDFDGFGDSASGGRRKLTLADQEALEFRYWGLEHGLNSGGTDNRVDCRTRATVEGEKGDCEPVLEDGRIRLSSESEGFGLAQMRFERPIAFRNAEGEAETRHLHFDSSMVTHGRLFAGVHFSETPSAGMPDLRLIRDVSAPSDSSRSVSIKFGGSDRRKITLIHWNPPGQRCSRETPIDECYDTQELYFGWADFDVDPTNPELRDRIFEFDIYISRTHVRILVDGQEYVDADIADIGFDAAYLSLAYAAYNPMKLAGGAGRDWPGEMTSILFDNIAFDGATLPRDGLVPPGFEQFIFMTPAAVECTIAGMFSSQISPRSNWRWNPVYTLVPEGFRELTEDDIDCTLDDGRWNGWFLDLHRLSPRP